MGNGKCKSSGSMNLDTFLIDQFIPKRGPFSVRSKRQTVGTLLNLSLGNILLGRDTCNNITKCNKVLCVCLLCVLSGVWDIHISFSMCTFDGLWS